MGDVVNLNHVRKAAARREREAEAAANRVQHGRTKAEKLNDRREAERRRALLEGAKREDSAD